MRIALVGYSGYWGRKLTRVVGALGHDVVAWIDRTNSEQLLMSRADAAIIATPPDTHFHLSMTALERGMDVLVEKPMTMRRTHAALLTETAHDNGLVLGVDSTFCHTKAFAYLAALDEPVISYQSIRLAPEMPQAVIPAGWDIVVHDLSILDGLGIRWEGVGPGGMEDGSVASASFLLPSGGSAFILASRCWPTKERAITIHMPSGTYYWTLKALFKVKDDLFDVVLNEDTEPLVNLITEFTKRCRTRELSGTTDGEHGLRVVGALERLFRNQGRDQQRYGGQRLSDYAAV